MLLRMRPAGGCCSPTSVTREVSGVRWREPTSGAGQSRTFALTTTVGTLVRADQRRIDELREALDDEGVETMLMTKVLKALSESVM